MRRRTEHRARRAGATAALLVMLAARLALADVESGRGVAGDGGSAGGRESFKTDAFTGAMTLGVPIEVPPATNGFEPKLTISYNSDAGITWLGRGWDLAFPEVQRMTRFGALTYSDAPGTGDKFSLGDDRLVRDDG